MLRYLYNHCKQVVFTVVLAVSTHLGLCADSATNSAKLPLLSRAAAEQPPDLSGKVLETMNSGGYTYVRIDTVKEKVWAAAPQFQVKVGDTVKIGSEMTMPNYHSKTLNRDFDLLYFATQVAVNGTPVISAKPASELPKGHPPIGGETAQPGMAGQLPKDHPPLGGVKPPANVDLKGIKKAEGGKTVAEIYAEQAKLTGKEVKVRGKVVKYNAQIMGKNWLHIQDGTGAQGSNDLTITTSATTKVGDTVLVTGVLSANKDFGAGYKYGLIVENAKVVVQ